MAPVTRARRVRATITGEAIEPLSPALTSNIITPSRLSHSHVRFEENTSITARRAGHETTEGANGRRGGHGDSRNRDGTNGDGTNGARDDVPEEEENSDNDAPEAVSMSAGKARAEEREEEARRIVEAQKEANRKKRKERDTKLKEQKTEAEERKRERESKRRKLEAEQDEQDAAIDDQLNREVMAASEEVEPAPAEIILKKSKLPLLLPESLLAQVSTRLSPSPSQGDSDADEDMGDVSALVTAGKLARVSARLEKNRRRRDQKKQSKKLKKGVVNVKVLKDEAASRKNMAPPASKKVAHIKESWLNKQRNGGIERRSVGGGFIRKK